MKTVSLSDARAELARQRILEGVAALLGRGEVLTFANLSLAAGVPERTCYRYFPTREALLEAVFDWTNERLGFDGERPKSAAELGQSLRKVFPGFDRLAPVIRELLSTPEGRLARMAANPARQRAALALTRREAPTLDRTEARRVAAVLQLLTAAATWQVFRDYWEMDGTEAAETSALAVELILEGARARKRGTPNPSKRRKAANPRAKEAS